MGPKTAMNQVPAEVIEVLDGLRRPVIVGHRVPDADCLGSMLAVAKTWPAKGGSGAAVCLPAGSVSQRLAFLVEWADARVVGAESLAEADGFIVLDTANATRCNVAADPPPNWAEGTPLVNIDHHETNTRFGDVNWVVPTASSCAELVCQAIVAASRPVTPLIASLLYAGLHADTHGFSLPNTSKASLTVAAKLVEAGARVGELGQRLYRHQEQSEFDLLRTIYANTRRTAAGRIAYSTASHEEITACGCTAADIDEQVDVPRSLAGIQMAILFTEGRLGRTRINLRGESGVPVLALAKELGGGGHNQAAGVVLECSLREAVDRVLPAAEGYLDLRAPA